MERVSRHALRLNMAESRCRRSLPHPHDRTSIFPIPEVQGLHINAVPKIQGLGLSKCSCHIYGITAPLTFPCGNVVMSYSANMVRLCKHTSRAHA